MDQQQVGNALLCVAASVATASVVLHTLTPWWRSEMGRHLMAYAVVIAAVLDLGVVRLIIGDSPPFQLLRTGVFALVPAVMAWRVWLQIKARRPGSPTEKRLLRPVPPPAPRKDPP